MKYLGFAGIKYYPVGGWHDLIASGDDLQTVIKEIEEAVGDNEGDWGHVVDITTGEICYEITRE